MNKKRKNNIPIEKITERTQLVEMNYNLVRYTLNRYFSSYYDQEDLEGVGAYALVNAVDKYDVNKNIVFSTYAINSIKTSIARYIQLQNSESRYINNVTISLNEPLNVSRGNDTKSITLLDTLACADSIDLQNDFFKNREQKKLYKYLKHLTPTEQICLVYNFGLYNQEKKEGKEMLNLLGFSRARYYQVINNGISKIKILFGKNLQSDEKFLKKRDKLKTTVYPIIKSIEDYQKVMQTKEKE